MPRTNVLSKGRELFWTIQFVSKAHFSQPYYHMFGYMITEGSFSLQLRFEDAFQAYYGRIFEI